MNEQALFGLMTVAQEQQQAAALQLAALEQQQATLTATIEQARRAVEAMSNAGIASAGLIERATKMAVDKAVADALAGVSQAASESLANAVNPALKAINGAARRAQEAENSLQNAIGWIGWKWAAICGTAAAGLLAVTWSVAIFMTPSGDEMAELRAGAADLERRGGKIKLSLCGSPGRMCAQIDEKQINAEGGATLFGADGEKWLILKGY